MYLIIIGLMIHYTDSRATNRRNGGRKKEERSREEEDTEKS
jgi:hypothetical protein